MKCLLRNVKSGEKHWYANCYFNGIVKENQIIFWQGPDDETKQKYKILAFQGQAFDRYVSPKKRAIERFATSELLNLDLPPEWREELTAYLQGGLK